MLRWWFLEHDMAEGLDEGTGERVGDYNDKPGSNWKPEAQLTWTVGSSNSNNVILKNENFIICREQECNPTNYL